MCLTRIVIFIGILLSMTEVFTFVSLFLKVAGVGVYPRTDTSTSSG